MAILLGDDNFIEWWKFYWQLYWVMEGRWDELSDPVVVQCWVGSHTLKSLKVISALLVFFPLRNLWKLPTRSLISWCVCVCVCRRFMNTRTRHMCKQVKCQAWIVCNNGVWLPLTIYTHATRAPTNAERAFLSCRKYLRRPLRRCGTCRHQCCGCLLFEICVQASGL